MGKDSQVSYLLNLIYLILIAAVSPWLVWSAVRKGKYREGYAAKFLGRVPQRESKQTCIWLHAVSVGEVNLLAPLVQRIEQQAPHWQCVISTTTMTGMELARKKFPRLSVFYCPLDFSWAVHEAMRRVRPDLLVLAELELWPNLIRAARDAGAKVAVVNGRLSEHSYKGYRRIRPLVAGLLRRLDLVAVQDETYAQRFRALGALEKTVHVTGSMKYDGAQTDRNNVKTCQLRDLAGFVEEDVVFLAGSTQEPEEAMVLDIFSQLRQTWPTLRLIIVPRHPDRFDAVARLLDRSSILYQRRTELDQAGADGDARVLLVDVVGELGAWWGTAHIAYVGGSMGKRGGQNMIEPAGYGAAVSFGPNTRNFRDIVAAMLQRDAAVVVADGEELRQFVERCLASPEAASVMGERARSHVQQQIGATQRTVSLLGSLLESSIQKTRANRDRRAA